VKGLIAWFAGNKVAANLLMVVIMVAGAITVYNVKMEVFPEFSLDLLTVQVQYLGASPEEVEEAVNVRIEEAIQGIDGVKKLTSIANEGFGVVTIELEMDANASKVLDDVKSRVDAIDTFPIETEKPVYTEVTNRQQVINLAVSGPADEKTLREIADQVRDELSALPEITLVELANARPYEISVEVSETALRRYGLTLDAVAQAVRQSSLDLPAGSVKTAGGEILLRTKGQAYVGRDFEDLVLFSRSDGSQLLLGDVATVKDAFAETDQFSLFNGHPAVLINVFRTGDQRPLKISRIVHEYAEEAEKRMPEGVELSTWLDAAKILNDRLTLLARNGLQGFLLVILILALFLRFRLSLWVSLGIPISFLGAMWLMPGFDVTINLISLFAFIVVLGIVVDDAIIVGENIHRHQHATRTGLKAAIEGANEVSIPVLFAVLTTVAAFSPLLSIEGMMGKVMGVVPLIVIPTLLFSLVESLLILPAHLSHGPRDKPARFFVTKAWGRFQGGFASGLEWFIARVYRPGLELGLRYRYVTLSIGFGTLILTLGIVLGGFVQFTFFPPVEADYISAAVTMPQGTPPEVTAGAVSILERTAIEADEQLAAENGGSAFRHVQAVVGDQPYLVQQSRNIGGAAESLSAGHRGEVTIELVPSEDRHISSEALMARWREITGAIPEAVEVTFTASLFSAGEDVNVQLTGPDIDELRVVADAVKLRLGSYAGVYEVSDSFREGKQELKLNIKPAAEIYGLRLADVARQVRQAFYGEEAQRVQRGREDIRVMVRFPESERSSLGDVENMRIRTPAGLEVPFNEVAEVDMGRGYASIKRVDRRRAINVTASVNAEEAAAGDIIRDLDTKILPEILAEHPGVLYSFEGQQAEQRDTMMGLARGFGIALFIIFALLAIPLRSYLQPIIIMSAIPFGLVGAVWGHIIMGLNLTVLSMFGIVALAGVVVNDSLVMVTFVNRRREGGLSIVDAAREAGAARFRPILLTSLTTFGGLTPLLLETSMQAQFLIPMAVSLAFGVMFSTFITLVLVPSGYLILEDLKKAWRWLRGKPTGEPAKIGEAA
jgi:multidrug efflux pump subunit AcrB